ncbi:polyisoprenoid-binding protein [Streptomyces sp. ICN441]|uniref:YceI family protein n=1 Tax=Streptomyces sp. ICN441 TaxID=2558286 RepID=UPI0010695603|nr:YceI family protein [Streptomyces sp. ICN441]TFE54548.1 polyisoprenoid-binding protein [Streptomyces sp. ICN441]
MSTAPLADTDQLIGVWQIDTAHSEVSFTVRHLMARVRGNFSSFDGTVTVGDDPARSSVRAEIDTTSIDTRNAERDKHLRSADYFDSDEHPTALFESAAVQEQEHGRYSVEGLLTIRGETRPVTLDLELLGVDSDPWGGTRAGFRASTRISRSDFGVTGNVPLGGGRTLIGDSVEIALEIEAIRQQ